MFPLFKSTYSLTLLDKSTCLRKYIDNGKAVHCFWILNVEKKKCVPRYQSTASLNKQWDRNISLFFSPPCMQSWASIYSIVLRIAFLLPGCAMKSSILFSQGIKVMVVWTSRASSRADAHLGFKSAKGPAPAGSLNCSSQRMGWRQRALSGVVTRRAT